MVKESIIQEHIILHVYAFNNRASKYLRQKLKESHGKTNELIILAGDFHTPLSIIDISSRQKTSKDRVELNTIQPSISWDQFPFIDDFIQQHILLKLTWNNHQERLHSGPKFLGYSKSNAQREIYSIECISKKTTKKDLKSIN